LDVSFDEEDSRKREGYAVTSDPQGSLTTLADTYNNGGIVFYPAHTWTTCPLSASPTVYNLQAADMSSGTGVVTADNPWRTRQTVLTFRGESGYPPITDTRTVPLNQTNYAIRAYNNATPNTLTTASNLITLRNTNDNTLRITSNAGWKATVTDNYDIMIHTIPATGGVDNNANGSSIENYTVTGKDTPDTKYETATIMLEDNNNAKTSEGLNGH
jgi:hypothetical protein